MIVKQAYCILEVTIDGEKPTTTRSLVAQGYKLEYVLKEASNTYRWLKDFILPDRYYTIEVWQTIATSEIDRDIENILIVRKDVT